MARPVRKGATLTPPMPFALTPFERALVHFASHGFSNREIAEKLGITEGEVEHEIASLVEKTDVSNRMELTLLFMQGKVR